MNAPRQPRWKTETLGEVLVYEEAPGLYEAAPAAILTLDDFWEAHHLCPLGVDYERDVWETISVPSLAVCRACSAALWLSALDSIGELIFEAKDED